MGQERTLNITVQPATVSTQVTVSGGDLAVVDTSSAAIGGNVSEREVAELPINGRQISQLYLMTPGAVNFGPGTFDDIRFNGRSFEENALRYDGIEAGGIITNNPSNIGGEINGVSVGTLHNWSPSRRNNGQGRPATRRRQSQASSDSA